MLNVSWAVMTARYLENTIQRVYAVDCDNYLERKVALLAQWVLVNVNDVFVLQQLLGAGTDVSQVVGHKQRGSHDGP